MTFQELALSVYRTTQRAGLLDSKLGQRIFLGSYWQYKRFYEDSYGWLIREKPELFKGGHILDVGANVGFHAVLFGKHVEHRFRVWSFEPNHANFVRLTNAVERAHLQHVTRCYRFAIGKTEGEIKLLLNPDHHADHKVFTEGMSREVQPANTSLEKVPMTSIDLFSRAHLRDEPVAFIKIDVQGYEPAVCEGLEETLARNPKLAIGMEFHPEGIAQLGFDPRETFKLFWKRGLRIQKFDRRKGFEPVREGQAPSVDNKHPYCELLISRD